MIAVPTRAVLLVAVAALAACGSRDREFVVTDVRPGGGPAPRVGASSAERFGVTAEPSTRAVPAAFDHVLPDGWEAYAPSPMKEVDLGAPGGVAVWVSRLAGGAGGPLSNLTRWRAQLGLGPADESMLETADRTPLLGTQAWRFDLVDAEGAQRTVGLMAFRDTSSVFVRMSGPRGAVAEQLGAFERFVASLEETTRSGADVAGRSSAEGLSWSAPAAWFGLTPGQFQLARFRIDVGVEAWISVLAGDGGGLGANVARWCEQYGRAVLDQAEIEGLPRMPLLGTDALVVDLTADGDTRGMIGVVCLLPARAVFVKMDGPSRSVRAHEQAFLDFCATLELDG